MGKQTTINIISGQTSINIVTESEVVSELLALTEDYISQAIYKNISHDLRGRITSINMSLYMLGKMITPESQTRFDMLKTQIDSLSQMIEDLTD